MRKVLALCVAAAAALMVSSLFVGAAGARNGGGGGGQSFHGGGGGGGGRGGGHSFNGGGGGGRAMSSRSFNSSRSFTSGRNGGPHVGRSLRGSDGPAVRSYRSEHSVHSRGHRHARRHHGRRLLFAAPFVGAYGYYGYSDCEWLRQRALATGSAYWWDRYDACFYGYY